MNSDNPAPDGGRPRSLLRRVGIVAIPVGIVAGVVALVAALLDSEGYLPGGAMVRSWEAPRDLNAADHGNGGWLVGDTVIRTRFDAVTGFGAADGKQRWEYVVPGRAEICAVSTTAADGVGLIAYGEDGDLEKGGGCVTAAAIDLRTGDELWHTPVAADADVLQEQPDLVAVGGGLAVLRDGDPHWTYPDDVYNDPGERLAGDEALRAVDARTGAARWKAAVPEGCVPYRASASDTQVLAVLACDRTDLELAAFGPADGALRWRVPLDARRSVAVDAEVSVLSADPPVVQVAERTDRGVHAFLSFTAEGAPRGRIEFDGAYGEISADASRAKVAVSDGRLFAVAAYPYKSFTYDQLVAFDLKSGDEVWRAKPGKRDFSGLYVGDGRVTAVSDPNEKGTSDDDLHVFDARTGDEKDDRSFREDVDDDSNELADVYMYRGLLILARWGDAVHPLTAYREW
ncbi:PQQ-binding-like beta-propeller repeat protein [Streptomyces sp. NBC_00247]|uniref:outer membrane protein assembly factor BamB family protein n=1 Tax=Streptomyces sp. NBC_00247 TaxID=2975689 RepID=UPI002E27C176|nr:PQQ-binding-like beta-propeller repeat protein [Streptomyces sp. NBC_00247]